MDTSDACIDPDKGIDAIEEKIKSSPLLQNLRRSFGPNWFLCLEKISCLGYDALSRDCIPRLEFRRPSLDRAKAVFRHWKTLQAMKEDGTLNSFREGWDRLTKLERCERLQRQYPKLSNCPHADVYAWAQSSESERSSLDKRLFMTPLLNIEDLSQDDVLPDLLDARATWHPGLFHTIDGRSIYLGIFGGVLKFRARGGISFTSGAGYEEAESYSISFQDEVDPGKPLPPSEVSASIGILQLQAQSLTYDFLVSFPKDLLDSSTSDKEIEQESKHPGSNDCLSLWTLSSRSDYYGQPKTVDLKYLDVLVKASLNEALDDLWQLRKDPELWGERLDETPAKKPGRVSNLLHVVFHRIDIFQSLSLHLDAVQQHILFEAQHDGSTSPHPPDLASLYSAFQSSLDEKLCQLHNTQWSPEKYSGSVFSQLFDMLKENDPTVWIMDFPSVMRIIDREIRKVGTVEIPIGVMQALNDLSILAVCVRETYKHYNFEPQIDHANKINELEAWWKKRKLPWISVLSALSEIECHKLDVYVRRREISPQERLRTSWTMIDRYMNTSCQGNETKGVIELIQESAPIDIAPLVDNLPVNTLFTHEATPAFSYKEQRRPKPRKTPRPEDPSPITLPTKEPDLQPPIVVKPARNKEFWAALLAPPSENGTELHWSDFCNAMRGIGYTIIPQTGSVYRFQYDETSATSNEKLGTIIFHAPHRDKVTHREGRKRWLGRLLRRFKVEL
ncbi:hypothetical protein K469DRAFT_589059 [Zopfia rhizophila CBS 207.26]|uniref:Clr5 domain-containing protein n=1 Tax=Zopfia rhizophila CBS 207.26 TaxID=1314779 RepID=A0A6A6DPP8_9PEZI|nr:hypothetical protein K469DRAFT_589059 [Zopfia rhizophila CBS 207.26]